MPQRIFANIWYIPTGYIRQTWRSESFRDSGNFVIIDESIQFIGARTRLNISDIRDVSIGEQGRDLLDRVKMEFGQNGLAYLADGSYVGWGGLLGGTIQLYSALAHFNNNVASSTIQ